MMNCAGSVVTSPTVRLIALNESWSVKSPPARPAVIALPAPMTVRKIGLAMLAMANPITIRGSNSLSDWRSCTVPWVIAINPTITTINVMAALAAICARLDM